MNEASPVWNKHRTLKNKLDHEAVKEYWEEGDEDVPGQLFSGLNEYIGIQSSNEGHNAAIRERFKEVYEQQADKIAAYREELGLVNPHEA